MRPLRLELRGFTAFREPVAIDFTELDVFAISGPTGSGKSSLLDAMTYALYGQVERVGHHVGQLISQGQPRMAVTLEFEVGHDRYRLTRSTPSGRGATKILLERLAEGEWVQAGDGADRVREAQPMIARAIGLTYDGFIRSVLLPQGKFAEFLIGDAKKRRDLLTDLLGLSLFGRMAQRANRIADESSVRAQERRLSLDREYADVTPAALKEAKAAAAEAEKRERALAAAAEAVVEILGRWQEANRSAEELRACEAEVRTAAERVMASRADIEALGARLSHADEEWKRRIAAVAASEEALEAARTVLEEVRSRRGSTEELAEARLSAHSLGEAVASLDRRTRERQDATAEAETLGAALRDAEDTLSAARAGLARYDAASAVAENSLDEAKHQDLVAAVSSGLSAGDPCPVCGQPLPKAPKRRAAGALHKAEAAVAIAREEREAARVQVADAERATHDTMARLTAHAAAAERLEADIAELETTVHRIRGVLRDSLGDPLPDDPSAEIDRRLDDLRRLDQAERDASTAAADARHARLEAERERERVVAAMERQRDRVGFDPAPLIERARRAIGRGAPAFDVPVLGVGSDPAALAGHAERLGELLDELSARLAKELQARVAPQDHLLEEAHRAVGDLVEPASSLQALAASVNAACRSATATVATSKRDADDLATRLARKKELSVEAKELESRAILFRALAQELRADHLVAYLQAEALQTLAQAGSDRLATLSDGRYRVVCRDDEFLVVDTWNGDEERSVRTLSGGETFLASLALALALADQVRSMSVTDRARLDSLFLDEIGRASCRERV